MKPAHFLTDIGRDDYNTPVREIRYAFTNHIKIKSCDGEWEILSYYHDATDNCMVLDIERKKGKK